MMLNCAVCHKSVESNYRLAHKARPALLIALGNHSLVCVGLGLRDIFSI